METETEGTVIEHSQAESLGGNCDIGVDESASRLCLCVRVRVSISGETRTESAVESDVSFHTQ